MPTHPKHILIAPLDWGLGHTTRCVPLIRYIQSLGHHAIVACNNWQRSFIEETFGAIDIIHLEGYNITYSKWNKWVQMGLLSQLPGIHNTINREHKWLLKLSKDRLIDGIISDNRYGLHHPSIPSVIMTHQLQVQTGIGNTAGYFIRKLHYKYLNQFNTTWVVDTPGVPNLGGKLSHPAALPQQTKYIGLLSRFHQMELGSMEFSPLLIILSGPEPQRTILSKMLWQQAERYNGKIVFADGSDDAVHPAVIPPHITYYKRLAGEPVASIIRNAGMVICRSGYSSLMDLAALNKKAILIPTPGQTEQEYLGKHLHGQGVFYCTAQNGFDINTALKEAQQFPYNAIPLYGSYTIYKEVIDEWLQTL